MKTITLQLPKCIELGIIKPKKYYINLNIYRNIHYQVNNNLKIKYYDMIKDQLDKLSSFKEYKIKLLVPFNTRADIDNHCIQIKYLNDCLKQHKLIEDDNMNYFKEFSIESHNKPIILAKIIIK